MTQIQSEWFYTKLDAKKNVLLKQNGLCFRWEAVKGMTVKGDGRENIIQKAMLTLPGTTEDVTLDADLLKDPETAVGVGEFS